MNDSDPTRVDSAVFPPAMLMGVPALAVQLNCALDGPVADTWRKTLELFATGLRLRAEWLPSDGSTLCLHLEGPRNVDARRKAMLLNWLALSRLVKSVRVLDASRRRAEGLTIFVERNTTLVIAP